MDTPLVSIILSTYNGSRYICEAIDSVLAQDFIDFEFLIIDDASTDNTANILYTYGANDTRIRIFRNAENLKLVGSLNYGLQEARGKYIARIDDDDIWQDSTKLTRQVQELEKNTDIAVVGTFAEIINDDGQKTGKCIQHATSSLQVRSASRLRNQLVHTSILARRDILMQLGGYDAHWLYVEDYDLWLRVLGLGYNIINIPQYMVVYRVRMGSTTGHKYHHMQWLTFLRLFHEKNLYKNIFEKGYFLTLRSILVIIPMRIIQYLK